MELPGDGWEEDPRTRIDRVVWVRMKRPRWPLVIGFVLLTTLLTVDAGLRVYGLDSGITSGLCRKPAPIQLDP